MTREGIVLAAQLGALGVDPLAFLNVRDPVERSIMMELGKEMIEQRKILDHNLAVEIANCVGKLFKA
jgi:hypothetical protein